MKPPKPLRFPVPIITTHLSVHPVVLGGRRATLSASTGATTPLHGPRVSAPPHRPLAVYSPSHAPVPSLPLSPRASRIASARGESHRVWRAIGPLFVSLLSVQSHSLLPCRGCCTTLWGIGGFLVGQRLAELLSCSFFYVRAHMSLRSLLGYYGIIPFDFRGNVSCHNYMECIVVFLM